MNLESPFDHHAECLKLIKDRWQEIQVRELWNVPMKSIVIQNNNFGNHCSMEVRNE